MKDNKAHIVLMLLLLTGDKYMALNTLTYRDKGVDKFTFMILNMQENGRIPRINQDVVEVKGGVVAINYAAVYPMLPVVPESAETDETTVKSGYTE